MLSAACQSGNRSEYMHVEGVLRSLWSPGMLTHKSITPFFIIGSLYYSINEYLSILVKVLGRVLE